MKKTRLAEKIKKKPEKGKDWTALHWPSPCLDLTHGVSSLEEVEGTHDPPLHEANRKDGVAGDTKGARAIPPLRGSTRHNSTRKKKSSRSGPFGSAQGRRDDGFRREERRGIGIASIEPF